MIQPLLHDDALLADIAAARGTPAPSTRLHLWWLGQSGYLLQTPGLHLLIDPYLSDSLTRKYAGTDKPHVRLSARVVDPARLDFIDVVTSSHSHTDHLDPDTLRPLAASNPLLLLLCPRSQLALARERSGLPGDRLVGLDAPPAPQSEPAFRHPTLPLRIHAVPAAHETLDRDADGHLACLGYVFEFGSFRIYHSGDTLRYDDMVERLRPFAPDLAILPINGRAPERRVAGNLSGPEAAQLAHDIRARLVLPCHYDLFDFNTASPDAFTDACRRLNQPFQILQLGERLTLHPGPGSGSATP
ncbi:MAG: MBL fold metallo-hydrolase [Verrucomicrobiae bacterium]|nr:MBL fold metallo-hydrolase [Verrucomicrobiae bacterium]